MTPQEFASKVGEVVGVSDWYLLDQARINAFADCTEDHQFIHVDPEAAKNSPFGQTIAHGYLTLSMLAPMLVALDRPDAKMGLNYGFNKIRFLSPVKSGKRIRGSFKLLEMVEKRPGQWQQTIEVTVEIEGESKPALIAEWILQQFF